LYDDVGLDLVFCENSSYAIIGYRNLISPAGPKMPILIKTDSLGNQEWFRSYDNFGSSFYCYGGCNTNDGGYILTGYTSYGARYFKPFTIKTDSLGNELWRRMYPTPYNSWGNEIEPTVDGGYIIVGHANVPDLNYQAYLIKIDSSGTALWSHNYGGIGSQDGYSVKQTSDHGYILTGYDIVPGLNSQVYLLRTDSLGNELWHRDFGNQNYDQGNDIQILSDGGFIIAADLSIAMNCGHIRLIRTDSLGNVLWIFSTGRATLNVTNSVFPRNDGGYIVTGYYYNPNNISDIFLVKTTQEIQEGDLTSAGFESEMDIYSIPHPSSFILSASPNPFNSMVVIRFDLRDASPIDLRIYDITGREVATLDTRHLTLGENEIVWNAEGMPSGIYFARLSVVGGQLSVVGGQLSVVGSRSSVQKLLLLK
jgi:hypothetical protein